MKKYRAFDILRLAKGNWFYILEELSPALEEAIKHYPNSVPCPRGEQDDKLQLAYNVNDTGAAFANGYAAFHNGISLLEWANCWDRNRILSEIAKCLRKKFGIKIEPIRSPMTREDSEELRISTAKNGMKYRDHPSPLSFYA